MSDFVRNDLLPEQGEWIIQHLSDNDFYKETMGQFIFKYYRGTRVRFRFINRHKHIPLAEIIDEGELRAQLEHARTLRFTRSELAYLHGQNVFQDKMFDGDYLEFKEKYQLPPYVLTRVGDQYEFETEADWEESSPWECIYLATVSELLVNTLMREMTPLELDIFFSRMKNKLYNKLLQVKKYPTMRFADFGYRRRFSRRWHQYVLAMCQEVLGEQFTGASSMWMAATLNLKPIGTNAHELPMVLTALADTDEAKRDAQYEVLRKWGVLYPALGIALPDTYGSRQFWKNMPKDLAEDVALNWRGDRFDSGDPIEEAEHKIRWYGHFGVNPWKAEKISMPSDGNDLPIMIKIHEELEGRIRHDYGFGTLLTHDTRGCHPRGNEFVVVRGKKLKITWDEAFAGHSLVCKPDEANGRPCVKLSNNTLKATGPKEEIDRYMRIFGHEGRMTQDVVV